MKPLTMTIEFDGDYWTIRAGDRYEDKMDWGEMLSTLARVTMPRSGLPDMLRTAAQHKEFEAHWATLLATSDKDVSLITDTIK